MDIEWPFLGRDELVRRVTSAITEGPGGAVLQGPLGIGKTRLSQTVVKGLAARGWHVERCIGSPAGPGIPFGAIWHMASTVAAEDLAHELEKLRGRLLERAGSSPLVLVVDDANLVDTSSMALFLRLARFGDAAVLMTRRTGEPGNDEAITSLWKDGMAALFDVGPLDRETQDALVMHVLGTVEAAARAERLWQLSEGNPLFLRELLGIVIEGGADDLLTGGPYDLSGKGQWTRLAAIVSSRTRRLGNDERDALDVVAVAEPVPTELLKALASAEALASLERHGMVTVDELGGKERISTAHPVYGATLRATLPVLRRRAVCSSLAHVMLDRGPRDPGDRLMAASWLLEAGEQPPHGLAEVAAEEALAKGDAQLADRLASAAVAQSESVDALTTLATAKSVQHATDEARPLFERALAAAATDGERVRAVTALARHEAWIGQDPVRATALLEQTLPTLKSSDARAELGVELATFAAVGGNAVDTARVAGQALDDAGAEPRLVVSALVWSTLARCMLGWADGLERDLARGEVLAREFRNTLPQARDQLQINRAMWLQAVDLVAALRLVRAGHERAVRQGGLAGVWSTTQLLIVRDIGNLDRALGLARRAIGELERFDPFNNLPMVCAVASHVHSLRGEARAAAQWMERAGPVDHMEPRTRVHGDRAQVWLGMHGPEIAAAAAVEAGERAEAGTMVLWSVPLYHDAVRMGVPGLAVAPLSRLASRIDAPVVAAMARHAEAAAAGDPAGLTRVATEFEQLGSLILAAEALAQAGRWAGSDTPEAARAALRALRLAARCPGAATPPLAGMVSALTPREMEIATAAAAGRASRDIAEWLVLSTRTVDNHLASVYRKLGLSGRDELSGVIGAVDDRRVEGLESG